MVEHSISRGPQFKAKHGSIVGVSFQLDQVTNTSVDDDDVVLWCVDVMMMMLMNRV